jgi:hypothetical protein
MITFINMDFDSTTNKWWVEYIDENEITQKDYFNSKSEAESKYIKII